MLPKPDNYYGPYPNFEDSFEQFRYDCFLSPKSSSPKLNEDTFSGCLIHPDSDFGKAASGSVFGLEEASTMPATGLGIQEEEKKQEIPQVPAPTKRPTGRPPSGPLQYPQELYPDA